MVRVTPLLKAASIELGLTGLFLVTIPQVFSHLLFGADLLATGVALGRFAGIALLAVGLISWPRRSMSESGGMVVPTLSIYNILATLYLLYLGAVAKLAGVLLWPAVVLHVFLAILFIRAFIVLEQSMEASN